MWSKAIDAESKRQFCQWLSCDEDATGRTLAFLISLHDLGKASPSFQFKVKAMQDEIRKGVLAARFKTLHRHTEQFPLGHWRCYC
ncbi:MAG: hypothetical protein LC108_08340, partial [Anaerolineales bacterium]|nr:hypothetical protein [Anaerolineales bacterium]